MTRRPSAWVAIPVLGATLAGGLLGFLITRASCAPGSCTIAAVGIGVVTAAAMFFGVGVVVVLAVRSIAEWRELGEAPAPPKDPEQPPTC